MRGVASRAGEAVFRHQEIAFSVCMAGVAALLRGEADFSPALLWAFAALLAFNLAYHAALRRRGESWYVPMVSMAVNTVLVTAALWLSGGEDSPFWPMYLIPIFTACLYLEARHVAFAALSSSAFIAALTLYDAAYQGPLVETAQVLLKASVLAWSAVVTAQHAFRERRARVENAQARARLDELAARLEAMEQDRLEAGGGVSRFLSGLVYDLNGRLALIRGRAELLAEALGEDSAQVEDARAIAESARALGRFGSDVLRALSRPEDEGSCDVAAVVSQALTLIEPRVAPRDLSLQRDVAAGLPPARVGGAHLQQALLELLETAVESCRHGGAVSIAARRDAGLIQVRVGFEAPEGIAPGSPAAQRRLLEPAGAAVEALGMGRSSAFVVSLPAREGTSGRKPRPERRDKGS